MTNLQELFEVFNGQDIDDQFKTTLELIRKCRKERFVSIEDDVTPLRKWMKALQEDQSPYRVTYHTFSLSLVILQSAFREKQIENFIGVVGLIKSEMMGCATAETFEIVKDLYSFWDNLEISLGQISR